MKEAGAMPPIGFSITIEDNEHLTHYYRVYAQK
jgi:hypothetical protein